MAFRGSPSAVCIALWMAVSAVELAPTARADDETVLVRDLSFLDRLTNPCQITRTGALLPPQHRGADSDGEVRELSIEIQLALSLVSTVRDASGVPDCAGLHLESQPVVSDVSGDSLRQAMLEMYRMAMYQTAHLYLMAQELVESHHTCGNESFQLVDQILSLAGNLQNIMCVVSEAIPMQGLQPVIATVSKTRLHKYRDCPRRLMRNCLVLENTAEVLALALKYVQQMDIANSEFLRLREARGRPRHTLRPIGSTSSLWGSGVRT